jgi:hypothetical protein
MLSPSFLQGGSQKRPQRLLACQSVSTPAAPALTEWLQKNGAPEQLVELQEMEVDGCKIDVSVAARDIKAGETALRIPDRMVVTLDRVFEDETVAEVLTTDKLSELACLTLYLMCASAITIHSCMCRCVYPSVEMIDNASARMLMTDKMPQQTACTTSTHRLVCSAQRVKTLCNFQAAANTMPSVHEVINPAIRNLSWAKPTTDTRGWRH